MLNKPSFLASPSDWFLTLVQKHTNRQRCHSNWHRSSFSTEGCQTAGFGHLLLLPDDLFELGLVLGLAAVAWRGGQNARWFGLTYALAGIGLYRLGGRKSGWLAFRHGKVEYGIDSAGAKVPVWSHAFWRI